MLMPDTAPAPRRGLLGRRNVILIAAAVVTLAAGYGMLAAGQPSAGAVLLVLGYCVLFPVGIAL